MANPTPDKADQAVRGTVDTIKFARMIKQTYGRSSLTRDAKDMIAQYYCLFSSGIPLDDQVIIAKGLEAQYAALLVAMVSARSHFDRAKYDTPVDYLKNFHDNSNIPTLFMSIDSQLPDDNQYSLESAVMFPKMGHLVPTNVVMECWDATNDRFNTAKLNDSYHPEATTQRAMEQVVNNLRKIHKPAMEGAYDDIMGMAGLAGSASKDDVGAPGRAYTYEYKRETKKDASGKVVRDSNGRPVKEMVLQTSNRTPSTTGKQEIAKNNAQMSMIAPTLINLQLTSTHGNEPAITHNLVMGVKAMARTIPQEYMISNLADAAKGSRKIFSFIQYTEGERRLIADMIFGVRDAKEMAVGNRDMRYWISALKRRKYADAIGKIMTGHGLQPLATIVCTSYDVAKVMELTNVDLNEPYNAAKLLNKYYLLGFIIYDPESGRLKSFFDGNTDFDVTTISSLKNKQQKDTDLMQYSQFLRAAGKM